MAENLRSWFLKEGRKLPWREDKTPYSVWISEVMLQQTQVVTVIPYFKRWMQLFPSVEDLAKAPYEQVIKAWEGLGYYSRVRNLHTAAIYFYTTYAGKIPDDPLLLSQVKGFGPYTIGAVLSFGYHKRIPAVDGNILRVFSRFYGIEDPIDSSRTQKSILALLESFLPDEKPWEVNEGLIELGATVCQKIPECQRCPLNSNCVAYKENRQKELPFKKRKIAITPLFRLVGVVRSQNKIMVKKVERNLMNELYEFPYFEVENRNYSPEEVTDLFERELGIKLKYVRTLSTQTHNFTRYKATLLPTLFYSNNLEGMNLEKISSLPFSSGHRRILKEVL